jgi:DNA-binding MarR family transcriptional regulator
MASNNLHQPNLEDLLLTLRRKIVDSCRKEGIPLNLTFSQVEILRFIGIDGAKTMKSIAEYLKITPPSVTDMIAPMEKKGVVKRIEDPHDRRVVTIILTKKAKSIYELTQKRKEQILRDMLSRLSATDKKTLERIISILVSK